MGRFFVRAHGVAVLGIAACTFSGAPPGGVPADASVVPDAPDGPCDPTEAPSCPGANVLRACNAETETYVDTDCDLGCIDAAEEIAAHCGAFVPANNVGFGASEAVFTVAAGTRLLFDTFDGSIEDSAGGTVRPPIAGIDPNTEIGFRRLPQVNAPPLGIFEFQSLTVEATGVIAARSDGALVLVATGPIAIDGIVDISADPLRCTDLDQRCAGPGGGAGGDGGVADGIGATPGNSRRTPGAGGGQPGIQSAAVDDGETGGGGGGFGSTGAASGDVDAVVGSGAAGGGIFGEGLAPLIGGSGGGGGGAELETVLGCNEDLTPSLGGNGGGGGGAVQIVSRESVSFNGSQGDVCGIDAGGAGGMSGDCAASGGGGGAGGAILIEAPQILLANACFFAANGGGGGAADDTDADLLGENGTRSDAAAAGAGVGDAKGGDGAGGRTVAQRSPDTDLQSAGAGGGGGRILLRGTSLGIMTFGVVSPPHTPAVLVPR